MQLQIRLSTILNQKFVFFSENMVAMNISIYIEAMDLSGQFGCGILKMVGL